MYQLSFVFQGKVFFDNECREVLKNIQRVRTLYPLSEIILSTWSVDVEKEKYLTSQLKNFNVKVIFSEDPGALIYRDEKYKWVSNINRMLISSKKGIDATSRDYVVKLRTDSYFVNHNLKSLFLNREAINKRYDRDKACSLFTERVINCNLFARHSRSYRPFDFHPGDIMLLGRREDVLQFFDAPIVDESIFEVIFNGAVFSLMHFVPEQHLWVNYIKSKIPNFNYLGNKSRNKEITLLSEKYYINNFIPFSCDQLGFVWPKYIDKYRSKGEGSIYQFTDWLELNKLFYNNKIKKNETYNKYYKCKVSIIKLFYFIFYLPLRWAKIRRIIMDLKSRE
ncbi:WavE lipopolysaccharide synthesis family protein [Rosenbergiella nectarea]|uniref:WavE lipopolysaccharide synthesis family protein n=1 Tax=Rosenbergiella nectarea TaxID=988801 RepID=UPI001F4E8ACF|nr:WavE lipopolysaccharide synthesis family protein [Rosenbergiella nectarea]